MSDTRGAETFDAARAEAFAGTMMTALNQGAVCLMVSVGHRTGLFDAMSGRPPSTSSEIASAAGLHERYVREWLGAMVTGRIVELDPATGRYHLPAEHAAFLTRAAGPDNIAGYAQYIAELGQVETDIVHCFRHGGGVPYSRYPRLHEVMAEDQAVLSALESQVLPLVPELPDALRRGIRVLDVGCGRGLVLMRMAELFPASRFTGMDLSNEAIRFARGEAARRGLANVTFVQRDLSDFDRTAEPASQDFITTFDAIHDQGRPLAVLRGIRRALAPGGVYLMQDINGTSHHARDVEHPLGPLLYTISCMHCMTVSLAQGGEGLGAMWGEEVTRDYLRRAGFTSVVTHRLPQDVMNNWYVIRIDD